MTNKVTQEYLILSTNYLIPQGYTFNYKNQIFIYHKFYFDVKSYNYINK